jgi:hypothetical protein
MSTLCTSQKSYEHEMLIKAKANMGTKGALTNTKHKPNKTNEVQRQVNSWLKMGVRRALTKPSVLACNDIVRRSQRARACF